MNHQQDRDGSPAPDDIPFNEGDWSPITVEHIRSAPQAGGYPGGYDAWRCAWWPEKEEFVCGAGYLNIARVLDPLMQQRRWMDTTGYLRRAFKFHRTEALAVGPAVPSPGRDIWDFRWTHPELYVLTHAQDALEIAGQGNLLTARERWDDLEELGGACEAAHMCVAIREYLNVYLPEASGRLQVVNADGDWQFADDMGDLLLFRCLVCHEQRAGNLHSLRAHLRQRCPASVRDRLKRPRPPYANMRLRDNGAGPSGGTGGAPGTGAPVT